MLVDLKKSDRVSKELKKFKSKVKLISNKKIQNEAISRIQKIEMLIEKINTSHTASSGAGFKPNFLADLRDELSKERHKLNQFFKLNCSK